MIPAHALPFYSHCASQSKAHQELGRQGRSGLQLPCSACKETTETCVNKT